MAEVQTTQARHPTRATIRTVVAATVGFLPFLPEIVKLFGAESLPWVAVIVGTAGAITRVLAMPGVNVWLHQYGLTSWLAANPPPPQTQPRTEAFRPRWPDDPAKGD